MSLTILVEILQEVSEAVLTNNVHSSRANLIENIELVIYELDRHENSQNFRGVLDDLRRALDLLENIDAGRRESTNGRPRKEIPESALRYLLLTLNFKLDDIAKIFSVSKKTIERRLSDLGLSVRSTYTNIDDDQLCAQVQEILAFHPDTGFKRLKGYLFARGIKVTNIRALNALRTVDPEGVEHRRSCNRAIHRRQYFVTYSMELWHIDTHHKLIRWGLVIRGGIDGKSRTIVYLECGADNTAAGNFQSFLNGVRDYGAPLRTRSDKGGENVDVARYMIETRGAGRGSHICGKSVHNQRIERLWRDVHFGCLSAYRRLFWSLEDSGHLDCDNQLHLGVLQFVFVPRINNSLYEFRQSWNHHPLSSERNKTPLQIMFTTLPPPDYDIIPNVEANESIISDASGLSSLHDDIPRVEVRNWTTTLSEAQQITLRQLEENFRYDLVGTEMFINSLIALRDVNQ